MSDDGYRSLWFSKVLNHAWDLLRVVEVNNVSVDERTSLILEGIYFYKIDTPTYTMSVDFAGVPPSRIKSLFEGALIKQYEALNKHLTEQELRYIDKVAATDRAKFRDPLLLKLEEIQLGLEVIQEYKGRTLSPDQHRVLLQVYDMKMRMAR